MDNRNFKGIWIPKEIWLNKTLTPLEKIYLAEIDSLDDEIEGCYASNKHFEELFGQKSANATRIITNLKEKGWIDIKYEYNGKEISKRIIKCNRPPYPDRYYKNDNTCYKNDNGVLSKLEQGYYKNDNDRNTYIDKHIDNNINIVEQVIDYLNKKTGSNYRKTTKSTISKINARQNEGFNLEDFKTVIDKKYNEWYGTQFEMYLRPDTLFGTKFEGYLNQKNICKKETSIEKLQREIREAEMEEQKQ